VFTPSFPSGHALASAVVYLSLGVFAARAAPTRAMAVFVMMVACALTLLVGASRIYLGVHYPTDGLAGWLIGT
jgi:undecaprenyl-diphosphatase